MNRSINDSCSPWTRACGSSQIHQNSRRLSANTLSGSHVNAYTNQSSARAYDQRCAVCVLKKVPLLDAAHITADSEDTGTPVVTNGLTLCKIHHAAYDENILGISPDYTVHINDDVLAEVDGPMLNYGLQKMNQRALWIPHRHQDQPDRERLSARFNVFKSAG